MLKYCLLNTISVSYAFHYSIIVIIVMLPGSDGSSIIIAICYYRYYGLLPMGDV